MADTKYPKLRKGKPSDSIVYDEPQFTHGLLSNEASDYYGGQVAAESVPPGFQPLFINAPELLEALEGLLADYIFIAVESVESAADG